MSLPGAEVVVVGGGVVGCSIVYQLAKRGVQVALVERYGLGAGTSSSCAMGVQMQTKTPGPKLAIALESLAIHRELEDELGHDFEFSNEGGMIVAETAEEAEYLQAKVADLQAHGLEIDYLDRAEAKELQPALADHIFGSTYCPDDSVANPLYLTAAYAEKAAELGARIHTYTPVVDLELGGGRIRRVVTAGGVIEVDAVVNACGVWAPDLAQMVGIDLPIVPRRGQIFVTEPAPPFIKGMVLAAQYLMSKKMPSANNGGGDDLPAGVVAYQTRRGNLLVGSTREFVGFNYHVNQLGLRKLMRGTAGLLPMARHLHVIRTFAGLRPATPDGLPILERSPEIPDFYIAAGHEGDGIALSPITGIRMAQLITGEIEEGVLAPFASSRFTERG
ncbi:MAG: FAD-dependent oxidoreductase [Anaerolineae bacterium]